MSKNAELLDECKKCPTDAVLCKETNGRVEITSCIALKYPFTPQDSTTDICKDCPKNASDCKYNKEEKRVEIEHCSFKFYRPERRQGQDDSCNSCPVKSNGCSFDEVLKKVKIEECERLFYVDTEDAKDDICEGCPDNGCNVCVSKTECKVTEGCKEGFSLISEKRICVKCGEKCLECESGDKCTKCQAGFFVGETNSCEECLKAIPLCEECSNGMNCTKCLASMEYVDGKC